MNRYAEVESAAYLQRAQNGFIVEVVQMEEQAVDPESLVEAGELPAMGEIRAQQLPKSKRPVSKVFVFETLEDALQKLEDYFRE